ncbi:MAG: hypothetical protein N2235_07780 [Fischerella sp.]|nr:hypothetical protein [Fischerella sp.]
MERELLNFIFEQLNQDYADVLKRYREKLLPQMQNVQTWEFDRCLQLLNRHFGRTDLVDDPDSEAELQLCQLAESETVIAALFVIGFPLTGRPAKL